MMHETSCLLAYGTISLSGLTVPRNDAHCDAHVDSDSQAKNFEHMDLN